MGITPQKLTKSHKNQHHLRSTNREQYFCGISAGQLKIRGFNQKKNFLAKKMNYSET
jgi:hypothetical protein